MKGVHEVRDLTYSPKKKRVRCRKSTPGFDVHVSEDVRVRVERPATESKRDYEPEFSGLTTMNTYFH